MIRLFHVTSDKTKDGVVYGYDEETGHFVSIEVKEKFTLEVTNNLIANIKPHVDLFVNWAKHFKALVVVELQQKITFEIFWNKYNDKDRSSKKKSQKIWEKLPEPDQVKAYYHIDRYNRTRGNADKKYCETYLNAELWNN